MPRTDRTLAPLLALALLGAPALGVTSAHAASSTPTASASSAAGSAPRLIGTSTGGTSRLRMLSRTTVKGRPVVKPAPKAKLPASRKPTRVVVRPVAKPVVGPVAQPVLIATPVTAPVSAPFHLPYDGPVAAPVAAPVASAAPVAVPVAAPVAPVVVPVAETVATSNPASASSYKFLNEDQGRPVRWNPCQSVPWTFNPDNAPAGGFEAVQAAMAEIGRVTGLTPEYQGNAPDVPSAGYLSQSWRAFKPLQIGWTTSSASDMLAGVGPSTIGVARVLWTGSYADDGSNRTQIASAAVALNAASHARTTGPGSWYTYALHELGHAFGLAHVDDTTQIMNPVIGSDLATYGAGDTAGLQKLGAGEGCLPSIR